MNFNQVIQESVISPMENFEQIVSIYKDAYDKNFKKLNSYEKAEEYARKKLSQKYTDYVLQLQAVKGSSMNAHMKMNDYSAIVSAISMYLDPKSKYDKKEIKDLYDEKISEMRARYR